MYSFQINREKVKQNTPQQYRRAQEGGKKEQNKRMVIEN